MRGTSVSQTTGGPFSIVSPFNGAANVTGAPASTYLPIFSTTAAVSGATATADVLGKAATTTPSASDYAEVLTFVAAASF